MLADLVMMGGEYPYAIISGIAVLCAAWIWRGTR